MNVRCPTCRATTPWEGNEFRPFCCERCKLIDLGKWLNEEYRVVSHPSLEDFQDEPPPDEDGFLH